mmetsp:Transcript_11347/g.37564  ORF Transcript_11347/g.37564 Transcript_11347/m.37564 type:complete len:297 (-) Transcript_11347:80-970(-)
MARCGEARLSFDAKRQAPRLALHLPATIASRSPLKPAVLRKGGQLKRQVADVAEAAHRDAARRPHHQIGDGAVEGGQAQPGLGGQLERAKRKVADHVCVAHHNVVLMHLLPRGGALLVCLGPSGPTAAVEERAECRLDACRVAIHVFSLRARSTWHRMRRPAFDQIRIWRHLDHTGAHFLTDDRSGLPRSRHRTGMKAHPTLSRGGDGSQPVPSRRSLLPPQRRQHALSILTLALVILAMAYQDDMPDWPARLRPLMTKRWPPAIPVQVPLWIWLARLKVRRWPPLAVGRVVSHCE